MLFIIYHSCQLLVYILFISFTYLRWYLSSFRYLHILRQYNIKTCILNGIRNCGCSNKSLNLSFD